MSATDDREGADGASFAEAIVSGAYGRLHAAGDPRAAQLGLVIQMQELAAKALGDAPNPGQLSRWQKNWELARQAVAVFHSNDRDNGGRRQ